MALEYIVLEGNPFMENTYILYDDSKECIIFDPGCSNPEEEKRMRDVIDMKCIRPVRLINTHCHIDHVLGNQWVFKNYQLKPEYHEKEQVVLDSCVEVAKMYGIPYTPSPNADSFLKITDTIKFGNTELEIRFTPGHSLGSLCFIDNETKIVVGGDVLFNGSIGRTDLPGGNHQQLLDSISKELYSLDDDYTVLPGHGPSTTIGQEKKMNPFVRG